VIPTGPSSRRSGTTRRAPVPVRDSARPGACDPPP
jgi:hypothetical protein